MPTYLMGVVYVQGRQGGLIHAERGSRYAYLLTGGGGGGRVYTYSIERRGEVYMQKEAAAIPT